MVEEIRVMISTAFLPNESKTEVDIQAVQLAETDNVPQAAFFCIGSVDKHSGNNPSAMGSNDSKERARLLIFGV